MKTDIHLWYPSRFFLEWDVSDIISLFFHRACCYSTLFKNPTHALCFKIRFKTQSLFKTLECLRLLCHPTCFGHTLDHLQGMFLVQEQGGKQHCTRNIPWRWSSVWPKHVGWHNRRKNSNVLKSDCVSMCILKHSAWVGFLNNVSDISYREN